MSNLYHCMDAELLDSINGILPLINANIQPHLQQTLMNQRRLDMEWSPKCFQLVCKQLYYMRYKQLSMNHLQRLLQLIR